VVRRPLEREQVCLDGGRRTTQLMRDSLGGVMRVVREATVLDVTPHEGSIPGLTRASEGRQVAELHLSTGDQQTKIALVFPPFSGSSDESQSIVPALQKQLGDYLIGTVVSNVPGKVEVTADPSIDRDLSFLLAAAAATVQSTWAWDESPAIAVTVNGITWAVQLRSLGDRSHLAREYDAA